MSMGLDHILRRAPEFLGDDTDPNNPGDGSDDPSVTPAAPAIKTAADLRAAITAAGGSMYAWALPPAYPTVVQIALSSSGFKVQPDLNDPGSYKITLATGAKPNTGIDWSKLGLDSNTLVYGGLALVGIAIAFKVLKG